MTEAFRCDGCREFYSGTPAFEATVQGRTVTETADPPTDYLYPRHKGGVTDYDPVGESDRKVEWPRALIQSHSFGLCAECFIDGLLDAIHTTIHPLPRDQDGERDD